MKLIEEFREKVLNSQGSFVIIEPEKNGGKIFYFVQGNVGKARYVYGCQGYKNINFYSDISRELELLAIVLGSRIYVCDGFPFNAQLYNADGIPLPEGVFRFADIVKRANDYVRDVVFPEFYSNLEVYYKTDINPEYCRTAARRIIFSGMGGVGVPVYMDMFNAQDIADVLCGFMDFDKETRKRLEKEKDQWVRKKTIDAKIQELIASPETALPWERVIADRLRDLNAKMVTAEFEMEGKKSSAKICPGIIINKMISESYFDYYNFITGKKGQELFKNLGVESYLLSKRILTCKNICKIMYKGKVLYERKDYKRQYISCR